MPTRPPDDPTLPAIAAAQRLADALAERRAQLARDAGLTEQQWRALEEIAAPGFLPSLFARRRETSAAAVSKLLRQLQEQGLVAASIAPGDARQRRYVLTAKGRRALARIEDARAEAVAAVWAGLDARELGRFARFATEIAGRLEAFARNRR